jgi:hypothetical protein
MAPLGSDRDSIAGMTFGELQNEVRAKRRAGRVHIELRARAALPDASAAAKEFVLALGLEPPESWMELERERAATIATRVLHRHLAYDSATMPFEVAEKLARDFLSFFTDGATFLTNGEHGVDGKLKEWNALTTSTFDTGVLGVDQERVGMLWVEDED